jgi:hypothetical protein
MGCRHGSHVHVRLALDHGADPRAGDYAAVTAAATGPGPIADSWCARDLPVPADTDYEDVLLQLLDRGLPRHELLAAALSAAAAADNTAMLGFLVAQGADLQAAGSSALEAAAGHMALDALAWLLERGADVNGLDGAVLDAAVSTLNETMVETVLLAGADPGACGDRAFCTALSTGPWDLYSVETDFSAWRPAIIALLLRHGASPGGEAVTDALAATGDPAGVVDAVEQLVEPGNAGLVRLQRVALQACSQPVVADMSHPTDTGLPGDAA